MASNSSGLQIVGDRNRFNQWTITIGQADGTNAVVAVNDIVRAKIGRVGDNLLLEVTSDQDTNNGSSITAENPTTLSIEGPDLTFPAAVYDVEIDIWDTSESRIKKAERGILILRDSMLGDIDGA